MSEVKLTETQFIVQIAGHVMRAGGLRAKAALPIASRAYAEFLADNKISFGDPAYAWDEDAAVIVGREYETGYWEARRSALAPEIKEANRGEG